MKLKSKHIDKIGRIVVDSLLLVMLWGILALPMSTVSLLKVSPRNDVLSAQDKRDINVNDPTKTVRPEYLDTGSTQPSSYYDIKGKK